MPQGLSVAARTLEKPSPSRALATDVLPGAPSARIQVPEEGTNHDYELFCRVSLGDQFNDERYIALRKLGYGQYSTVWLARDLKTQTHVAVKFLRSDCYDGNHDTYELEMLQHIRQKSHLSTNPGRNHAIQLLDHFHHEGANGNHVCLVFPVLGHHLGLQAGKFEQQRIPVAVMKEVARHCSKGSISCTENAALYTQAIISSYLEQTSARISQRQSTRLGDIDKGSEEAPMPMPLSEVITTPLISEMDEIRVRIIDFGVSSWVNQHLSDRIQSPHLRAPEVMLGAPWGTGVDIWSLGSLMIEFVKGHLPFPGTASQNGTWTAEDDRLAQLIEVFGPFPEALLKRGVRSREFFDDEGNLLRILKLSPASLLSSH
ncbi:Uncharacterized protein BP5553_02179 [Venustampulla echinocandica]|uniref:non-specific serine/threonine protein kinase n=1 Tax=Venustampulla echinocandica TaxID=2656787 RepID=A0A370U344_9HELO|nr:Uncharacterized protein BP5553_02179 [Venustampulla echinocandica]RDL42200.1 Uncharacterized protein BP5553_02179 [Venustampulla echinocandica]